MGWDDSKSLALIAAYEPASLPRYQRLAAAGCDSSGDAKQGESQWMRKQAQVASSLTLKVAQLLGVSQAQLSLVALSC